MPDYSLFGDEHVKKYEETDGTVGHDWNDTSCLVLRMKGRKSGQPRKAPLIYGRDGDDYVLIASKGGAPEHPGWYENLMAHPDVEIQVRIAPAVGDVHADEFQLQRVFTNLLVNACYAVGERGLITIKARPLGVSRALR